MINRTRITVDEATREVLDQLSSELSKTPSWALELTDELRQAIDTALHDGETKQLHSLDKLKALSQEIKLEVCEKKNFLTELGMQFQNLTERVDTQGSDLLAQTDCLSRLQGAIEQLEALSGQQSQDFLRTKGDLNKLADLSAKNCRTSTEQSEEISRLKDLCVTMADQQSSIQSELTEAFRKFASMQQEICSEQIVQRDLIEKIAYSVDSLRRPWWRRFFSFWSLK